MDDSAVPPAETAIDGRGYGVDSSFLDALAEMAMDCIDTDFPHFVGSVEGPDDRVNPRADHPVFYGCFDWHSAVHSHWSLVRQLRVFPDHHRSGAIRELLDDRLTREAMATEAEFFEDDTTFERPYGWAWTLRLAAELELLQGPSGDWREAIRPLESRLRDLVVDDLLEADRPIRVGTHGNTAFALSAVVDYARVADDPSLEEAVERTARLHYAEDQDVPVGYEPFGWDFLSPALEEAELMRRILDPDPFDEWFATFWPTARSEPILEPIDVDIDSADPIAWHLVGLNLARSWALAGLADATAGDRWRSAAVAHAEMGLSQALTEDFAGSHWLGSFALFVLTRAEGGIDPESG